MWKRLALLSELLMKRFINKMRFLSISLFNRHLANRKSRIGNDLETSEVLRAA